MAFVPDLSPGSRFLLAGVGASAGGLPAYRRLLGALPAGAPLALAAINHAQNAERTLLAGALRGHSALPILEVESGMPIAPGHVYVIPAGRDLTLSPGGTAFEAHPVAKAHGWPQAITVFLDSLAQRWPGGYCRRHPFRAGCREGRRPLPGAGHRGLGFRPSAANRAVPRHAPPGDFNRLRRRGATARADRPGTVAAGHRAKRRAAAAMNRGGPPCARALSDPGHPPANLQNACHGFRTGSPA